MQTIRKTKTNFFNIMSVDLFMEIPISFGGKPRCR